MSDASQNPPYEDKAIRCPRLGGNVTFGYCLKEGGLKPCGRALVCWSQFFDVTEYFKRLLTEEEFERVFSEAPRPKIVTLLELIENAKRKAGIKG
jgi:hypothetical protein